MPRNRTLRLALVLGTAVVAVAGFVPWRVRVPVDWNGWKIIQGEARWIPLSRLELSNLEVRTQGGGRLRLARVEVRPRLWTLAGGRWVTWWRFGEVRVDPDSWGIRQQPAREILAAGPAANGGSAVLEIRRDRWILEQLALHGPLLRLDAKGWLAREGREGALILKGELMGQQFTFSVSPQSKRRS